MMPKIAVSACLLGYKTRYNGQNKKSQFLLDKYDFDELIPICPEILGGLPTPRAPAEIIGGNGFDVLDGKARVLDIYGTNQTKAFIKGAFEARKRLYFLNIKTCILKSSSPSCGIGPFLPSKVTSSKTIETSISCGVTAALFIREGFYMEEI